MTLSDFKRQTAERKAAGASAGAPPRRPLPTLARCAHLGDRLPGQPCGSPLLRCRHFGDVTARLRACEGADRTCQGCPAFSPQGA